MKPDRAWVRLGSGRRLNLLDPQPDQLEDRDIAVSLSRTCRWGGHSCWELPLSVAQHSLLVLRQQMQPHQPLTPGEALRELLHDADELTGFDPVAPLRPHLGAEFHALKARLHAAVAARYRLPDWHPDDYVLHKRADHLAAASEAVHVAGWHPGELSETLGIRLAPLRDDPLPLLDGLRPWGAVAAGPCGVPVPGQAARADQAAHLEALADLTAAIGREATLARLGSAFSRLPPGTRRRYPHPPTGSSLTDTFVFVETDDISQQHLEGRRRWRARRGRRVGAGRRVHRVHHGRRADQGGRIRLHGRGPMTLPPRREAKH